MDDTLYSVVALVPGWTGIGGEFPNAISVRADSFKDAVKKRLSSCGYGQLPGGEGRIVVVDMTTGLAQVFDVAAPTGPSITRVTA